MLNWNEYHQVHVNKGNLFRLAEVEKTDEEWKELVKPRFVFCVPGEGY